MTTLVPGMLLSPISGASRIEAPVRVLHVHAQSNLLVVIAAEPQQRQKRLRFASCEKICLSEILSEIGSGHLTLVVTSGTLRPGVLGTDDKLGRKLRAELRSKLMEERP